MASTNQRDHQKPVRGWVFWMQPNVSWNSLPILRIWSESTKCAHSINHQNIAEYLFIFRFILFIWILCFHSGFVSFDALTHLIEGEFIVKKYERRASFAAAWIIMCGLMKNIHVPWIQSDNTNETDSEKFPVAVRYFPVNGNALKNNAPRTEKFQTETIPTRTLWIVLHRLKQTEEQPTLRRSNRIAKGKKKLIY